MPNDLPAFQTPGNNRGEDANPRALWRFRVSELITDAPGGATLVKARTYTGPETPYDANQEGKKDYIVKANGAKQVGQVFYATKPEGGCDATYGTPQKPVVWMEATGGINVAFGKAIADWQSSVGGPVFAFDVTPCDQLGNVATPAPANVKICTTWVVSPVRATEYLPVKAGDVVAYLPVAITVGGIACAGIVPSLPDVGGAKFAVRQNTGQYTVGYDFVRSSAVYPASPPTPPPP